MRLNPFDIMIEARLILRLAWPVMLTSLNWTLLHLIDIAVVSLAGTTELGALAAGRTLTFISIVIGIAALSGVLVYTARSDGAGDHAVCGDYLRQGLLFGLGMGLAAMVVLLLWAQPLAQAVGISAELMPGGVRVVQAMALAFPAQFTMAAAAYFLEGMSRPTRPMVVNLAMLPANAVLAWAWAGGHWGFEAQGAVGAALATAVVSVGGAIAMIVAAWTLPDADRLGVRKVALHDWRAALLGLPRLVRFGFAPAIAGGLEIAGFSWLIALSTQLGVVAAAAFQNVFSLHNFAFGIALGFGSAAGVRVGNAVGAGESTALSRSVIAALLAMLSMGLVGLVYFLAGPWLMQPFSSDAEVMALSVSLLLLMAPFMLFDGAQIVFLYALRSLGDQVVAGINGVVAFFFVSGGLGWWMIRNGWGAPGLVWALAAGMVTAALLHSLRLLVISRRR